MRVRLPGSHFVGTIADDVFRADPGFAVFFHDVLRHGCGAGVGEHVKEVGGAGFEFDLHGVFVQRFDAELAEVFDFAFGDSLGVFHRIEEEAVFATGGGVNVALPGIDNVGGGQRGAV